MSALGNALDDENNLAEILGDEGRCQQAERLHREVLASPRKALGPQQHADTLYSCPRAGSGPPRHRRDYLQPGSHCGKKGGQTAEAISRLPSALEHGLKPRAFLRIETHASLRSCMESGSSMAWWRVPDSR